MRLPSIVFALALTLALSLAFHPSLVAAQSSSAQGSQATSNTQNPNPGQRPLSEKGIERIVQEVHHQLVLLPFYGVFDNLGYSVSNDGTVTLFGQVVRPTLKSDAENVVKKIEGVEKVVNNIQVLPASPMDDTIRREVYRAIYGNPDLSLYALRAVPPIHIIVDRGHVTLVGAVARQMDKQIAEMQAKSVPGVFSVDDQLVVDNGQ